MCTYERQRQERDRQIDLCLWSPEGIRSPEREVTDGYDCDTVGARDGTQAPGRAESAL